MVRLAESVAAWPIPIVWQLATLRLKARTVPPVPRLLNWGRRHLGLQASAEAVWHRRAWWGLAAGEVLRAHLYDPRRRPSALGLVEAADWSEVRRAHARGGVILAGAHIGPPKAAMNVLMDLNLPLMVWTNMQDLPAWQAQRPDVRFVDPLVAKERSLLLAKSALHLRDGGILFGAPDWPSGTRTVALDRLGIRWSFSQGIPALARKLELPVFLVLALWHGNRIRLACTRIRPPPDHLDDAAWYRCWMEDYWNGFDSVIRSSPENLRFLRGMDDGALLGELGL